LAQNGFDARDASLHEQLNNFIALWVIIAPIAALPIFISLTAGYDRPARRRIAVATNVASFFVLCFFIALGQIIIEAMAYHCAIFKLPTASFSSCSWR
jgi:small neutral amino acid transporter SnatA (MarC family)